MVRSPWAVFWPSVTETIPFPSSLDDGQSGPPMTTRTVRLAEDAARISPSGVGPQERDLGPSRLAANVNDSGLRCIRPMPAPAWS